MSRPLLICDCDEVLLHMVRHFGSWLRERHDITFAPHGGDFTHSMTRGDGSRVAGPEMRELLGGFFPAEMSRQTLVPGAAEALAALSETADIVILTNLGDHCREHRITQLAEHGIRHRVETNQGGKGGPVAALIAEYDASVTVFVDDMAHHHESVAVHAPGVHRLHMVSDPEIAGSYPTAPHAHARLDDWAEAHGWIAARFAAGRPATIEESRP